tara:strand:- start:524 stop:826 length:303 start_codon:yes stop_codon:yes gene_type:complete
MKLLTENELDQVTNDNKKVLLQFSATWCMPCKTLTPVIENYVKGKGDIVAYKVDISDQQALAQKFNVRSVPKLVLFVNGTVSKEAVGMMNEAKLKMFIES